MLTRDGRKMLEIIELENFKQLDLFLVDGLICLLIGTGFVEVMSSSSSAEAGTRKNCRKNHRFIEFGRFISPRPGVLMLQYTIEYVGIYFQFDSF
jgi:hypothetical protein